MAAGITALAPSRTESPMTRTVAPPPARTGAGDRGGATTRVVGDGRAALVVVDGSVVVVDVEVVEEVDVVTVVGAAVTLTGPPAWPSGTTAAPVEAQAAARSRHRAPATDTSPRWPRWDPMRPCCPTRGARAGRGDPRRGAVIHLTTVFTSVERRE
jgi:hypothetical protein